MIYEKQNTPGYVYLKSPDGRISGNTVAFSVIAEKYLDDHHLFSSSLTGRNIVNFGIYGDVIAITTDKGSCFEYFENNDGVIIPSIGSDNFLALPEFGGHAYKYDQKNNKLVIVSSGLSELGDFFVSVSNMDDAEKSLKTTQTITLSANISDVSYCGKPFLVFDDFRNLTVVLFDFEFDEKYGVCTLSLKSQKNYEPENLEMVTPGLNTDILCSFS